VRYVAEGEGVRHGTPAGWFGCSRGRRATCACGFAGSVLHDADKVNG
jgi:hypothetical protein